MLFPITVQRGSCPFLILEDKTEAQRGYRATQLVTGRAQFGAVCLGGTQILQRNKSLSFKAICSLVAGRHPRNIEWGGNCKKTGLLQDEQEFVPGRGGHSRQREQVLNPEGERKPIRKSLQVAQGGEPGDSIWHRADTRKLFIS